VRRGSIVRQRIVCGWPGHQILRTSECGPRAVPGTGADPSGYTPFLGDVGDHSVGVPSACGAGSALGRWTVRAVRAAHPVEPSVRRAVGRQPEEMCSHVPVESRAPRPRELVVDRHASSRPQPTRDPGERDEVKQAGPCASRPSRASALKAACLSDERGRPLLGKVERPAGVCPIGVVSLGCRVR